MSADTIQSDSAAKRLAGEIGAEIFFEEINGFRLQYVRRGTGKPVLLLHGANIGWGQWYAAIPVLATSHCVYALDLPGAGGSTKIDFLTLNPERDFVELVEAFCLRHGLHNLTIIGHSIGGWIGLKLALRGIIPLHSLVLVNSLGFSDYVPWRYRILASRTAATFLSKTVMSPTRNHMRSFLTSVMKHAVDLNETFVDAFFEGVVRPPVTHPFLFIHRLFSGSHIRDEFVLTNDLQRVTVPTLIVAGGRDPLLPLVRNQEAFSLIHGAQIKVFPHAGHVVPLEFPDEFNAAVATFL